MVRSGARPGQVLSSGRHTGPAKLTNGKKATYLRKIPRFNADSGYSIHSDSESQAETVHGLDGCASLLRDILRNEDSASSDNKKQIPNEASARSERDTSDLEQNWSLQDHYRMYSPIIYQALCEHVQTQMSLMNDLTSKNIPNGIPAVPCHAPSHSESQATPHSSYGLCTSTPVWSLQRPPCPPKVHSEVQTDGNSQFASQEDSEIQRLITEMEACISVLPTVSGNTDIQVEIALAMQPLRSENAQLRRQLRILNQQLREQQKTQKPSGAVDCNLELFSLQSLNMSLQNQLEESLKSQELLQSKNEELLKVIENQKDENKKFSSIFKDKDQTILENKQQYDIEITRIKIELEEALVNVKSSQFKLETAEKENQILGITLRQRDAEVTRLRELTRTLQTSMAKLLSDLSVDSARCKPGNNLTKSLLNIHDKQLQHDPAPAHTSIMSYLNKLETNYSFTHSEPLSTIKNEETIEPDKTYENVLSSRGPQNSNTRGMEEASAPGIISALSKQDSDEGSETMALIEDEHNLDNTIYIPFARSTPEKKSPLSKRLSPQPQIRAATTQLVSNSGLAVSGKENKLCTPVICSSSTKEAEDAPEKLSRASDMKDTQLLKKIKEAIGKIPAATKEPEEQTACHGPSGCLSNSLQVKGNTVCDGSVFTSDLMSDWSISSFSTFTSRDEQDFRNGLAALDANIARLQKSLRTGLLEK
ncbi:coiled-coil domain-containing protein 14 isoform X4 [Homo sapiens]|uniref:coiled-coil domain-containing protein 14 isoform X4 n=1 Tax=Homo sapiens TaxID=9606 RepID=UPI001FB16D7A|nr:coiled-coil domain-containing protein 14 isoform X4 [Homo sapiens]XP_054203552.1 coiled-coil domain-containing protein 14 isoform X4 [Homo sapiens]